MGRTYTNSRDFDEWDRPQKTRKKAPKQSRNVNGKGMRVINSMSEDDYDDLESDYEDDDKYYDNTTTTQR